MVDFADEVRVAGDCLEDSDDGDSSSSYEGPTGDQYHAVEIEHVGEWAAVSFHQRYISFLAKVDGEEIAGTRTTGWEDGYREPGTKGAWLYTEETKYNLELTRTGWTVEGSLKATYSREETEWSTNSTDTSLYTCTTKNKFEGAKVEELD